MFRNCRGITQGTAAFPMYCIDHIASVLRCGACSCSSSSCHGCPAPSPFMMRLAGSCGKCNTTHHLLPGFFAFVRFLTATRAAHITKRRTHTPDECKLNPHSVQLATSHWSVTDEPCQSVKFLGTQNCKCDFTFILLATDTEFMNFV